jgi:hypothetical protein
MNRPDSASRLCHVINMLAWLVLMLPVPSVAADLMAPLQFTDFEHITFSRIPANEVTVSDETIRLNVNHSASFLMASFDKVRPVSAVSIRWRSKGRPAVLDRAHEEQKAGDDAVVKLGLLLRSDESGFRPFLPAWMQRVQSKLKYPSQYMYYLVADSRHSAGERWLSPYNRRITMLSMHNTGQDDGWNISEMQLDMPLEVVAVWLMADGDNTGSAFTTEVSSIELR